MRMLEEALGSVWRGDFAKLVRRRRWGWDAPLRQLGLRRVKRSERIIGQENDDSQITRERERRKGRRVTLLRTRAHSVRPTVRTPTPAN